MTIGKKDPLTDVAQNLPTMGSNRPASQPAGTVTASDGTSVTLGGKPSRNTSLPSTGRGMNSSHTNRR